MENGGDRETDSVDLQSGNKAVADQKKDHSVTCSPAFFPFQPRRARETNFCHFLYAFCRWRETATLKFSIRSIDITTLPRARHSIRKRLDRSLRIEANIRPVTPFNRSVVSFSNPFSFFLSLFLQEEGNTIDYNNKSGYFESSPLSRIHLVVTRRFFRGADGKLSPFTSETKKGGEEKWIRV